MTGTSQSVSIPKLRVRVGRYLPLLILLGLAVHLILPQITTLEHSLRVIEGMLPWAIGLALVAQVLSYVGSGYLSRSIVSLVGQQLPIVRGALISMAASSIGLVAGGAVGSTAATYRWVRGGGASAQGAGLAGGAPPLLNNGILIIVAVIGLLHLLVVHRLSTLQAAGFGLVLLILGLVVGGIGWSTRHRPQFTRLADWAAASWAGLRRQPYDSTKTEATIERLFGTWDALRTGDWRNPVLGAALNVGFDMLTLYCIFIAAGHAVSPGILLTGYGLPLLLGKVSFLPGGVGIVEGTMAALYDGLGVPDPITVVVILTYRVISFWLPSLLGFLFIPFLQHSGKNTHQTTSP